MGAPSSGNIDCLLPDTPPPQENLMPRPSTSSEASKDSTGKGKATKDHFALSDEQFYDSLLPYIAEINGDIQKLKFRMEALFLLFQFLEEQNDASPNVRLIKTDADSGSDVKN